MRIAAVRLPEATRCHYQLSDCARGEVWRLASAGERVQIKKYNEEEEEEEEEDQKEEI
ncbi:MAG: hypothetical protein ACRC4H_12705 [Plesiomonas sp.]